VKILIFWDIYGRLWRKAFIKEFPRMKEKYAPDFSVVNIENITSGRGPATVHAELIDALWVDIMTGWDHIFDNMPDIGKYFSKEGCKLIRPANFISSQHYTLPGDGYRIIEKDNKKLLVIQLLWEAFMAHKVDNPFVKVEQILKEISPDSYDGVIVEFHRETTAELYGMAHFLDGQVSAVYGTHTHIQTNDAHILAWGTGILTDVGMNGPFESVIWADFLSVKKRFLTGIQRGKIEQKLTGKYLINALLLEIDETTKLCKSIENISFTGTL
jgi:metallophosphoesterase (TIGR00282 family)